MLTETRVRAAEAEVEVVKAALATGAALRRPAVPPSVKSPLPSRKMSHTPDGSMPRFDEDASAYDAVCGDVRTRLTRPASDERSPPWLYDLQGPMVYE